VSQVRRESQGLVRDYSFLGKNILKVIYALIELEFEVCHFCFFKFYSVHSRALSGTRNFCVAPGVVRALACCAVRARGGGVQLWSALSPIPANARREEGKSPPRSAPPWDVGCGDVNQRWDMCSAQKLHL